MITCKPPNKDVFISGDAAGSLMFSHGAELHTRLLVDNFFLPVKKKQCRVITLGGFL
jgi:hypothetical protein